MANAIKDFRAETPGGLVAGGKIWLFPDLPSKGKGGKDRHTRYLVYAVDPATNRLVPIRDAWFDGAAKLPATVEVRFMTDSYQEGSDKVFWERMVETGAEPPADLTKKVPTVVSAGKNLGRKNATNRWTQALRDVASKYFKAGRGSGALAADPDMIFPMLATSFSFEEGDSVAAPGGRPTHAVSNKYDGLRAVFFRRRDNSMADTGGPGEIMAQSRGRKAYNRVPIERILDELHESKFFVEHPAVMLDGELFAEGVSLQDLNSAFRNNKPPVHPVKFVVFDLFARDSPGLTFAERRELLDAAFRAEPFGPAIEYARSEDVLTDAELCNRFDTALAEGFEGVVIRRLAAEYVQSPNGYHTPAMKKLKPRPSKEYRVVGFTDGRGKNAGVITWIAETPEGKQFNVDPVGSLAERKELFRAQTEAFTRNGDLLEVAFSIESKDGVPVQPKGLRFRDDMEL